MAAKAIKKSKKLNELKAIQRMPRIILTKSYSDNSPIYCLTDSLPKKFTFMQNEYGKAILLNANDLFLYICCQNFVHNIFKKGVKIIK